MDTLKSLTQEKNALLEKKQAAMAAVWSIAEKVEPRLAHRLRETVHEWYQSDINMLEWKFDYIEQAMSAPNTASTGQAASGSQSDDNSTAACR